MLMLTWSMYSDLISGPNGDFAVPTLDSLGLPPATTSIHGGETAARLRFDSFFKDHSRVATFAKPQTAPTSLEPSTTLLSPYLKFGCLSVREFYWRAKEISETYVAEKGEKVTKEPENLVGQVSEGMVDGSCNAGSQGN
jgi:cryptochrome